MPDLLKGLPSGELIAELLPYREDAFCTRGDSGELPQVKIKTSNLPQRLFSELKGALPSGVISGDDDETFGVSAKAGTLENGRPYGSLRLEVRGGIPYTAEASADVAYKTGNPSFAAHVGYGQNKKDMFVEIGPDDKSPAAEAYRGVLRAATDLTHINTCDMQAAPRSHDRSDRGPASGKFITPNKDSWAPG